MRAATGERQGRAYRSRAPIGWYALLLVICLVGVSLTVYSRNERLYPASAAQTTEGPTKSDHWHVALAFDICGKLQPDLPANTNIATTGLRTFGDGLDRHPAFGGEHAGELRGQERDPRDLCEELLRAHAGADEPRRYACQARRPTPTAPTA